MKRAAVFFCVISLFFFVSCGRADKRSALDILSEKMSDVGDIPSGSIYLSTSEEWESSYLSPELLSVMYGENAEESLALCSDIAIYLSERAPYEIAVFKCYSSADAENIAALCMKRMDNMRVILKNTEWYSASLDSRVEVFGRVVTASFCKAA